MPEELTSKQILETAHTDLVEWVDREIAKCEDAIAQVESSPAWTLYCARRKELLTGMKEALPA